MAKVKFSRKEFEKHVKIDAEIEERIRMFGTSLESLNSEEVELEIYPNRPDLLSLQGYLRSFLSFIGKKKPKEYKINKPEKNFEVIIDKSVKDVRPFTACCIVKNLKFNNEKIKEIIDIQEKIHNTLGRNRKKIAIGIYPLEKIKLPITFIAKKPQDIKFQPLESNEEMNGLQILQRHPTGREYAYLLENKEKFPIFVDAAGEILSMPPIINSHKTGKITEETKELFIECSGFDLNSQIKTINILATTLADMGGDVYSMKIKYEKPILTPNLEAEKIKINLNNVNKLLGLELKEPEIKKLLEKMGYSYSKGIVEVPAYRTDILHEVDIIEDIAIAHGYENFTPEIPEISTTGEEDRKEILRRRISEIMSGLGMLEISSYHLLIKDDLKRSNLKPEIEVEKSKTDFSTLRQDLLTPSLKTLSENVDAEYPQKIFEIGEVFKKDEEEETGIKESVSLAVSLTPGNFTEIKQFLEYLGRMLNKKFKINEAKNPYFIEGRCGSISIDNKEIGVIGEISPQTLKNWHLQMPVASFEVDIESLL